nr:cationic amino acid transporter 7, chloroplastic-like [Tanacetum cinerariifolium]
PQARTPDFWGVPLMPWIPCVSIFLNIFLLGNLDGPSYARFAFFSALAVIVYAAYSVHASFDAEEEGILSHEDLENMKDPIDPQDLTLKMNEAVRVAVQIQTDRLRDSYQRENDEFIQTIDDNMKRIIKEQALVEAYEADKIILDTYGESFILKRRLDDDDDDDQGEGPSVGSDRGSKRQREGKESESTSVPLQTATRGAGRSTSGSKSRQASVSAEDQPIVQSSQHPEWFSQPKKPPTSDHSPLDFSNFITNRLRVDTLTPELMAGPTYELMKGSCNSLTELEYHLEEVYKATMDQLDWINPKGQQYPHNLLQPLPLIPDNRGRRVIPFAHFINNDLEYLRGGDFKRLRLQDIEDMLLLLVQGKLSNLTIEEHFAFNVSLRIDGMLNDVRNSLDDRLKGIRMQYLPQTIWRKGDKDRAAAMIQAIDKMLKTRRIIRSLERFVEGRLYEGDFRMLQRTI